MNLPVCRPLMDGSSPSCRCARCNTVRLLRPQFPSLQSLQLSPDRTRVAFVRQRLDGDELWLGVRWPLHVDRIWMAIDRLSTPIFSPDSRQLCVPVMGTNSGLFIIDADQQPRRLTAGNDHDPRWDTHSRRVTFYRLSKDRMRLMARDLVA